MLENTSAASGAVKSFEEQSVSVWCRWQETAGNKMKGFKLLLQAAEAGERSSMITMARAFDTGIDLSADRLVDTVEFQCLKLSSAVSELSDFWWHRKRDWEKAVYWYNCVLNMTDYDEGGEFDGIQDQPRHLLLAREAEMFQTGGFNLTANPQRAGLWRSPVCNFITNLCLMWILDVMMG